MIGDVSANGADALAAIHAQAFDPPWDAPALQALLASSGVIALADDRLSAGFILIRVVVDEAEILTLAVASSARRRGLGRGLIDAGAAKAGRLGAQSLFLEVAADNRGAIALYSGAGFALIGRRRGYYTAKDGAPIDALVLKKALPSTA
jgi:ribosomal-protein-alanine N-acetyltransferase